MHGQKLELVTRRCTNCGHWVALRIDKEDFERVLQGQALIQDQCPYLSAADRELVACSGWCSLCWDSLVPSDPLAFN